MTMYDTHVFLGPTLDIKTAKRYLWQAHYHSPIQCGDLVRLLRLSPKRIILIDGLYEQVPAVWHKEIMLALDRCIEVYGAASMGALRAAELHAYGMQGIGKIFEAYKSCHLTDDDEVAVLHYGHEEGLLPINDAMVNIRETLEQAHQKKIISNDAKESLLNWCKAQFYPNRSLQQALKKLSSTYSDDCSRLTSWVQQHGLIDLKRLDAIEALQYVQSAILSEPLKKSASSVGQKVLGMPYTKFIASLVDDVDGTPFRGLDEWFPEIEKKIQLLFLEKPDEYKLVFELSKVLKLSVSAIDPGILLADLQPYLHYIESNDLYFPEKLYESLQQHPVLNRLYPWMLHYTCLGNITHQRIMTYLPAMVFYMEWDAFSDDFHPYEALLSWILLFILLLHQQLDDDRLKMKRTILMDHLDDIRFWQRYHLHKQKRGKIDSSAPIIPLTIALDLVTIYMKISYVHQGFRDIKLGLADTPDYFNWIHDALGLVELSL